MSESDKLMGVNYVRPPQLKFNKVFTETYASRHHHISILKMNKFELEGRLKKHTIKDNKYEDSLIHSILKK